MGHYDDLEERFADEERERQGKLRRTYFESFNTPDSGCIADWDKPTLNPDEVKAVVKEALKQIAKEEELANRDYYDFQEPEFMDYLEIFALGAQKYDRDNWLEPDGKRSSHKEMHDSMFHHLAESFTGKEADDESGLHPLLHLIARAMMVYTRYNRGIIHPKDEE